MSGDFIAGLVEGEGCFAFTLRRDRHLDRKKYKEYFYYKAQFAITLRKDDLNLLKQVQEKTGFGHIYMINNMVRYDEQNTDILYKKVIPFFRKYPLYGKKKDDFELWSEAVKLLYKYKKKTINVQKGVRGYVATVNQWPPNVIKRLNEIISLMKQYKSLASRNKWLSSPKHMESVFKVVG